MKQTTIFNIFFMCFPPLSYFLLRFTIDLFISSYTDIIFLTIIIFSQNIQRKILQIGELFFLLKSVIFQTFNRIYT